MRGKEEVELRIYFKSLVIIKIFDQQGSFESFVKYENPLSSNGM